MRRVLEVPSCRLFLLLAPVLTGCGGGAPAGSAGALAVTRDTVGDTVVVRTVSGSSWGAERMLEPEVSIGEAEGDSTDLFGFLGALGVGPDGTIYVLDQQGPALRAYGPDGVYRRTLGRPGRGPGELALPRGLLTLDDGRVLVDDPGNRRIQVYGADGTALAAWPFDRRTLWTPVPLWRDAQDDVLKLVEEWKTTDPPVRSVAFLRIGSDGSVLDTLRVGESGFQSPTVSVRATVTGGMATYIYPVPFAPVEVWAFHPAGYAVHTIGTRYAIDLMRRDAPTLRIERTVPPVPVSPAEWADTTSGFVRTARTRKPGWEWSGPDAPASKPPLVNVMIGRRGRIWAQVAMPGREEKDPDYDPKDPVSRQTSFAQPIAFDVFEPDGTYLGRVTAPADFRTRPTPVFNGDYVWAVTQDDLGVERVVRYRVTPDGSGKPGR